MPMVRTFREALIVTCAARGISLADVARGSGVSPEQLKKVKQREGASTNVDDAVKVANFFGFTLDEFLQDDLAAARAADIRLWSELTAEERAILRDAARGRASQGRTEG